MSDNSHQPQAFKQQPPPVRPSVGKKSGPQGSRSGQSSSFTAVEKVLTRLVNRLGLDRRLKEHALLSLWPSVVPETIAIKSRPLFLDCEGNLVVAVRDASIAQELVLLKPGIMTKLRAFARGLGVEVKSLRCDLKQYHVRERPSRQEQGLAMPKPDYSEEELAQFVLNAEQLNALAALKSELEMQEGTSCEIANRILSMCEREMRIKLWRHACGLPPCPSCNEPSASFHGRDRLCLDCYFASMSQPHALTKYKV